MLFSRKLSKYALVIVLALISVGIIAAGYSYYKNFEKTHRISVEQQLKAIADLKAGEIVQWRRERLGDASVYYKNAELSGLVKDFFIKHNDEDSRNKLKIWLYKTQSPWFYDRVFILDTQGAERISFPDTHEPIVEHFKKDALECIRLKRVSLSDFHRHVPGRYIHLAVFVPIYDEQYDRRPLGVLVLRIDPEKYLYPLIELWPTPSKTAETLLIRKEGNEVVFLNELRFRKNSALVLHSPLTKSDMPAVQAAMGKEGIVEGRDYRGVPVIAFIRKIPNSPWFLVARVDKSEVYAPVKERLWITIILVTVLLAGAGGIIGLFWRLQTMSFFREQVQAAEEIKKSEARYRLLADHMSDTVWLMDLNLKTIYTSPSVEKFRGYTADEIKELPLEKHLTPESFKRGMAVFQKEMAKIKKDPSYSFVHTLELEFYRKDGSTIWSENKFSLIRDENGNPVSILGEGRDITERKRSEEALRFSEEKFRKAFLTSPDSIAITRLNDGMFISINEGFTQITGYSEADVIGKTSLEINIWKDPEDRRRVVEGVQSNGEVRNYEAVFLTKYGEINGLMSATVIELEGVKYILNITRDITEWKCAEEMLRTSESFLNSIIDQSPSSMWISDSKGTLIRINKACCDLLHISAEEVLGKYNVLRDNIVNEQGLLPLVRRVFKSGETANFELVYDSSKLKHLELADTTSVILDVTIFPVRDATGKVTNAVIQHRDITERRRAEEAIRESEGRVRAKLDAILSPAGDIGELELADIIDTPAIQRIMDTFYRLTKIGIGILDIRGNVLISTGWQDICTKYHRIHPETNKYCLESDTLLSGGVEPGSYKMYKCKNNLWDIATPIIVGGKHLGNLFLGQFLFDDEPLDEDLFKTQAKKYGFDENEYLEAYRSMPHWSRETVDAVMNFYMKLAELISLLSYSNIKLAQSLTDRDRIMNSLQESEERYRSLVEHAPDAILVNREDKIVLVNQACLNLFGAQKAEELLDKSQFDLFHPDYHDTIRERLHIQRSLGKPVPPLEEKIVRLDGGVVDVEVTAAPFSWGGANAIHILLRDITERKRAAEELSKLYAELEQRVIDRTIQLEETNKELEAFSYSVSHDLRAPLRHMSGFVDLLEKRFSELLPEKGRHYMNNIADSTRQMGTLIDDLLDFSRTGRVEMLREDIDMNIILKEALKQLDQDKRKRKIEWIIPPLPPVYGDRAMLKLVWLNLLGNAVKFTLNRKKARIEVGAEEKNGEIVYFVKDNGVGFDMKYVHKLFGVFQRLHSAEDFEGTGVGLANVRRIIARHGGRTWAEARLNKGAAFYFSMPKLKEKL